jgi:hypothetical protein
MVIDVDYSGYCCDWKYTERTGHVYGRAREETDTAPMSDDKDMKRNDTPEGDEPPATSSRRQLLMGGAIAASAIVSIRPALASTAASVLNCRIPVPDAAHASQHIATDGSLVAPGTDGAVAGAGRAFTGEEVKGAMRGRHLPGTTYEQNQAYMNYIRRLQSGTSGFTCYASLQMPR